jgi:hemerythrin-like domain-containing protein
MEHDLTQDHARHSVAEHKELDDFIKRLDDYDMSSWQWLQTARELRDRLVLHVDEEEKEIFAVAGKALAADEKSTLSTDYESDMDRRRDIIGA